MTVDTRGLWMGKQIHTREHTHTHASTHTYKQLQTHTHKTQKHHNNIKYTNTHTNKQLW